MYSIRPFDIEDADLLASFGYEGIGFEKMLGQRLGRIYAYAIAYGHMMLASEGYACLDKGRPIGFLLYKEKGKEPRYACPELEKREKEYLERFLSSLSPEEASVGAKVDAFILDYFGSDKGDDGELLFLCSDLNHKERGIGRTLLEKLAENHKGSRIALLSDSNCNLAFYEAMGFGKIRELSIPNPKLPGYTCYIYAKTL